LGFVPQPKRQQPLKILVTGHAGFIGMHTCARLLAAGHEVVGVDNFNDYYDVQLKRDRAARLGHAAFTGCEFDLADAAAVNALFAGHRFDRVIHLAAQAGVRYSLTNPRAYVDSNVVAFVNVLEACRHAATPHLVLRAARASTATNSRLPFSEHDPVDHPVSLYAATKKANELMAHSYSHLFGLPTTGLRFFTVYGPWGRPDMARCCSRRRSRRGGRSTSSTTGRCSATSRTSTTSSRASSA
jgi:UDP-glucuronate 4-epimerase